MIVRRTLLLIVLSLALTGAAVAQSGGQLWVRVFEDRNSNRAHDPGEPYLMRAISVNVMDADGVVLASGLIDDSPNKDHGLVGFQLLPPGDYLVSVTSPEFSLKLVASSEGSWFEGDQQIDFTQTTEDITNEDVFRTTVSDVGRPPVLEIAAQPVALTTAPSADTSAAAAIDQSRLAASLGGAVAVVCIMAFVGFLIYVIVLRRRLRNAQALDLRTTTGAMRPVTAGGTGEIRRTNTGTGEFSKKSSGTGQYRKP
jgi:hypothetical protein